MLNGMLETPDVALDYIRAGRGRITLESVRTGTRFTYKFGVPRETRNGKPTPIFVKLLDGNNNETDYTFLGSLWMDANGRLCYRHGRTARTTVSAPSVRAFTWTLKHLENGSMPDKLHIWHEGVCCRCGRALTVPESVSRGIGPECRKKMGV